MKKRKTPGETPPFTQKERNVQNLYALASHPLNRETRVQNGILQRRQVRNGKIVWVGVPGLVDRIKECFYPEYDYRAAENAARRQKWVPSRVPPPPNPEFVAQRKRLRLDGRELGQFLDDEQNRAIDSLVARRVTLTPALVQSLKVTLYTKALLNFYAVHRWQPLFSQFVIHAPDLNVGTRIDDLCMDDQRRLIVVERKYGYDDYREFGNARMSDPLDDCLNSPQYQHVLQCGLAILLLQKYYNVKVHAGFVIYITDSEVYPKVLPTWFWQRSEAIWKAFSARLKKRV